MKQNGRELLTDNEASCCVTHITMRYNLTENTKTTHPPHHFCLLVHRVHIHEVCENDGELLKEHCSTTGVVQVGNHQHGRIKQCSCLRQEVLEPREKWRVIQRPFRCLLCTARDEMWLARKKYSYILILLTN